MYPQSELQKKAKEYLEAKSGEGESNKGKKRKRRGSGDDSDVSSEDEDEAPPGMKDVEDPEKKVSR